MIHYYGKKHFLTAICFIIALFSMANPLFAADDYDRLFFQGVNSYEKGDFKSAISSFAKIANMGIKNGKLFYNIGNAYLKNGQIGRAILWYSRSQKLDFNDPDLKFNMEYAETLRKDSPENKISPIFKILFFQKHFFGSETLKWTAITLNFIFWGYLSISVFRKRKGFSASGILILFAVLLFTCAAFYDFYKNAYLKTGIILPKQVSVRSGFTQNATELFILHAGTKVTIEDKNKGYFKIRFSNQKIGWIDKTSVGII